MSLLWSEQNRPCSQQPPGNRSRGGPINYDFVNGWNEDAATRHRIKKRVMRDYLHKKNMRSASFLRPDPRVSLLWRVKQQGFIARPSHVARSRSSSPVASLARSTARARRRLSHERPSKSRPPRRTDCRASPASSASISACGVGLNAVAGQATQPTELPQDHAAQFNAVYTNPAPPDVVGTLLLPVPDSMNRPVRVYQRQVPTKFRVSTNRRYYNRILRDPLETKASLHKQTEPSETHSAPARNHPTHSVPDMITD